MAGREGATPLRQPTRVRPTGAAMVLGSSPRDARSWLMPLAAITMIGVGGGILVDRGPPAGPAGPVTVGLLAIAAALSAVALSARVTGP